MSAHAARPRRAAYRLAAGLTGFALLAGGVAAAQPEPVRVVVRDGI